jgi:acetylglutamate/LysW-gamma-L-alpha-aminoadipate kinase
MLIKIGGSVLENIENLLEDLPEDNLIIVHGGAKEVTRIAEKIGKKQEFIISPSGYKSRYTDKETMEIFQMVIAGSINKNIVRILSRLGKKSFGLCGLDSNLVRAKRKKKLISVVDGRRIMVDGGYTGKITEVDGDVLQLLLKNNIIPVVGAVAISEEFEALNVDGDRLTNQISQVVDVHKIIFFTDQDGVIDQNGKVIQTIKRSNIEVAKIGPGMKQKLQACAESRANEVIIANGLIKRPFSNLKGTVIVNG